MKSSEASCWKVWESSQLNPVHIYIYVCVYACIYIYIYIFYITVIIYVRILSHFSEHI